MDERKEKNLQFYQGKKDLKVKNSNIAGLILAGGKSRRMFFKDKSLKKIESISLIDLVLARVKNQIKVVGINSNNPDFGEMYKNTFVLNDCIKGNLGPLVGVLTGLKWLELKYPEIDWLVTFPVDTPFFPTTLIGKIFENITDELIVSVKSKNRTHPALAAWNIKLANNLEACIQKKKLKIDEFTKNFKMRVVNFQNIDYDPFFNINNDDDLKIARNIYKNYIK